MHDISFLQMRKLSYRMVFLANDFRIQSQTFTSKGAMDHPKSLLYLCQMMLILSETVLNHIECIMMRVSLSQKAGVAMHSST
jgi:hypothetical protein